MIILLPFFSISIIWVSSLLGSIFLCLFSISIFPISIYFSYLLSFKNVNIDFDNEKIFFSFFNRLTKRKQEFEVRKDEIHSFSFDSRNAANLFWLKIKEGKKIKINTLDFYPIIPKDYCQFKKYFEEFVKLNKILNQRKEANPMVIINVLMVFIFLFVVFLIYNLINS